MEAILHRLFLSEALVESGFGHPLWFLPSLLVDYPARVIKTQILGLDSSRFSDLI